MDAYTPEVEGKMKRLFDSLKENDRRRYAAIEAAKLGHGGIEYIARVLGCDPKTIRLGLGELEGGDDLDTGRSEKRGWPEAVDRFDPAIEANFHTVLEDHTAGDPMRDEVKWTNLSRRQIARRIADRGPRSAATSSLNCSQAPLPEAEGVEEEDDGPPPSGSQRPVREHRPPQEGVLEGRLAGQSASTRRRRSCWAISTATA